jgi:glycosyltransferase involved in cell wall biosynthesis
MVENLFASCLLVFRKFFVKVLLSMVSRRLRVLFLASYFPKPNNPYMGTWAMDQAQALARQPLDLQVVSFTSWIPPGLALTPGAKAYAHCPTHYTWSEQVQVIYPRWLYYPVPPLKQWAYVRPIPYLQVAWQSARSQLCAILQQFQPDVIFCHHSLPNGWLVAQLSQSLNIPLVTSDYDFEEISDAGRYPHRKAALARVTQRADLMLCASNRMTRSLSHLFPQANAMTFHQGIDLPTEDLLRVRRPEAWQGKTIVLCCALFAERKGIPLLVEAFNHVVSDHPDAILRIIGDGSEVGKVRQAIDQFNLGDRVQLVGKKPHAEVLQEMLWADCFALVGWDEPFATVYLEAMAAGKPIICCNDGGINDVLVNGVQGYAVPPRDVTATATALKTLLSAPQLRLDMGRQARALVERSLTWDRQASALLQRFEAAIDRRASVPSL